MRLASICSLFKQFKQQPFSLITKRKQLSWKVKMARAGLLLAVFWLALVNDAYTSDTTRYSALTLVLCKTLQKSKVIGVRILAVNGQRKNQNIAGDGETLLFKLDIGKKLKAQKQNADTDRYQFQIKQNTIEQVTLTSSANHICVKALVVDTIIVVDQPTDFKSSCSNSQAVLERPCKRLGKAIDVSRIFVCPERLKDLLVKKGLATMVTPGTGTTGGAPPTYDIINDMMQASSAIAEGITTGTGTIVEARQKYRDARKASDAFQRLGTFARSFETIASFIGAVAPFLNVFSGIASIATTYLTPNPFDEIAKYLDAEFRHINNRLSDIQNDIADLGRLIEAKGGVLAMTNQLSAIRYAIRNYGNMVKALSTRPVCAGAEGLKKMPEVKEFIHQYKHSEY